MEKIIAINAGSSSLKFKLFAMPEEVVLTEGIIERIGQENAEFKIYIDGVKVQECSELISDHQQAVNRVLAALLEHKIVKSLEEISAVGHRVVHGGEYFSASALVDDTVVAKVAQLQELAPLHNPANLMGYRIFAEALPKAKAVFVFDTAFHQTMDASNFLYGLPYQYYQDYKIRRYGFHGTSHQYVSQRVAALMGKPLEEVNIISCHLGNGASITAIKGGKSLNTSMGFTPLSGVMMGTRTGDIDAQVVPYLCEKLDLEVDKVIDIFNKKSGMLGLSGISHDARDIEKAKAAGDERAIITRQVYANRIATYIGAYFVLLGRLDAIVFTAGLGENDAGVRADIMDILAEALSLTYDKEANKIRAQEQKISAADSKVEVWIVPTNEELVIARDTYRLMYDE